MSNHEKLQRWYDLHGLDRIHCLTEDGQYEHDVLENELVERGLLDDSGYQTILTDAGRAIFQPA